MLLSSSFSSFEWTEEVSSHHTVERSWRIKQTLHPGASGRYLLTLEICVNDSTCQVIKVS